MRFLSVFLQLVFIFLFRPGWALAQNPQQEFLASFSSERLVVLPPDAAYPPRARDGFWGRFVKLLETTPDFRPQSFSPACDLEALSLSLQNDRKAVQQVSLLREYADRCRDEIETGTRGLFANSVKILRLRFDDREQPFVRRVDLKLPGGVLLHGLLAMKGDLKKRPWVILRLGIFGNLEEQYVESFILRQLFEQGPFNVLVVENITSKKYLERNPGFSLGGALEGPQNLQIARLLRDPAEPISKTVQSLHMVGMSLGGHGVFHGAGLEAVQEGLPLFQSHLAFCPVVQFRATVYDRMGFGLENTFVDMWFSHRTPALRGRTSELQRAGWGTWWRLQPFYWKKAVDYAADVHPVNPGITEGLKLPPGWGGPFWEASEPWKWFQNLKSPLVVMTTREDDLVPVELNSFALMKEMYNKQNPEDVAVMVYDQGYHCTLPTAYHWDVSSAILNSVILASTSREFDWFEQDLDLGKIVKVGEEDRASVQLQALWDAKSENPTLRVGLKSGEMSTEIPIEIPRRELDFKFLNSTLTEAEREMGVAWLSRNAKTRFLPQQDRVILQVRLPRWK